MNRTCIAIVDASRARLFTFDRTQGASGLHEQLVEQRDLIDPARRLRPSEQLSDSRPGSSRTGGLQFGFDDHRDAYLDRLDTTFARAVVDEIEALLRSSGARRLILCASPRMLGELRAAGGGLRREGLVIDELPRDLVKLTVPKLRERLGSYNLLPPLPRRTGLRHSA
ncbi:MAG TPA: host attachment protein [Kofleriaceae bacterium]